MSTNVRTVLTAAAGWLCLAPALLCAQTVPITVDFAPRVEAGLQFYGVDDGAVLRTALSDAVARRIGTPHAGLAIYVTLQDVAPTHPTRKQLSDHPALDATRTRYLGGAQLLGQVRDATQREVASVQYRYFAPTLNLGSASPDPWGDARLAFERFAGKLAAAYRKAASG